MNPNLRAQMGGPNLPDLRAGLDGYELSFDDWEEPARFKSFSEAARARRLGIQASQQINRMGASR